MAKEHAGRTVHAHATALVLLTETEGTLRLSMKNGFSRFNVHMSCWEVPQSTPVRNTPVAQKLPSDKAHCPARLTSRCVHQGHTVTLVRQHPENIKRLTRAQGCQVLKGVFLRGSSEKYQREHAAGRGTLIPCRMLGSTTLCHDTWTNLQQSEFKFWRPVRAWSGDHRSKALQNGVATTPDCERVGATVASGWQYECPSRCVMLATTARPYL